MGNVFCTKVDDENQQTTKPYTTTATTLVQDERNASVITAGIDQLRNNATNTCDPQAFWTGDVFDSLSLNKRLTFFPAQTETVLYSASVTKTNKRGKQQDRVWVLTDQAFYNFETGSYSSCKRRIGLQNISQLLVNSLKTQLLVRVPTSYDYICECDSTSVNAFASILVRAAPHSTPEGSVLYIPCQEEDITPRCVTKGSDTGKTWKSKRGRVR